MVQLCVLDGWKKWKAESWQVKLHPRSTNFENLVAFIKNESLNIYQDLFAWRTKNSLQEALVVRLQGIKLTIQLLNSLGRLIA